MEALPCILRQGANVPMYGLLIRQVPQQGGSQSTPSGNAPLILPSANVTESTREGVNQASCSSQATLAICQSPLVGAKEGHQPSPGVPKKSPASGRLVDGQSAQPLRKSYPAIRPRQPNCEAKTQSASSRGTQVNADSLFIPAVTMQVQGKSYSPNVLSNSGGLSKAVVSGALLPQSLVLQAPKTIQADQPVATFSGHGAPVRGLAAPPPFLPVHHQAGGEKYQTIQSNIDYARRCTHYAQANVDVASADFDRLLQEIDSNDLNLLLQDFANDHVLNAPLSSGASTSAGCFAGSGESALMHHHHHVAATAASQHKVVTQARRAPQTNTHLAQGATERSMVMLVRYEDGSAFYEPLVERPTCRYQTLSTDLATKRSTQLEERRSLGAYSASVLSSDVEQGAQETAETPDSGIQSIGQSPNNCLSIQSPSSNVEFHSPSCSLKQVSPSDGGSASVQQSSTAPLTIQVEHSSDCSTPSEYERRERGLLVVSGDKSSHGDAGQFDDMPVLVAEGLASKTTSRKRREEIETPSHSFSTDLSVESSSSFTDDGLLSLEEKLKNVLCQEADPVFLVETIFSILPTDKLETFQKVLEERINASKRDQDGLVESEHVPIEMDERHPPTLQETGDDRGSSDQEQREQFIAIKEPLSATSMQEHDSRRLPSNRSILMMRRLLYHRKRTKQALEARCKEELPPYFDEQREIEKLCNEVGERLLIIDSTAEEEGHQLPSKRPRRLSHSPFDRRAASSTNEDSGETSSGGPGANSSSAFLKEHQSTADEQKAWVVINDNPVKKNISVKIRLPSNGNSKAQKQDAACCSSAKRRFKSLEPPNKKQMLTTYIDVKSNIYGKQKPPCSDLTDACSCKPPKSTGDIGCGDGCINRALSVECDPSTCPCGTACSNQAIQRGSFVKLEVYETGDGRGKGVRALEDIEPRTFIIEYVGEVLEEQKYVQRRQSKRKGVYHSDHYYAMYFQEGWVIDSTQYGSLSRFINHSCDPNCVVEKWWVLGFQHLAIFSNRKIFANEPLSYDYKSFEYSSLSKCLCNSENCRGYISFSQGKAVAEAAVPDKLAPHCSSSASTSSSSSATITEEPSSDLTEPLDDDDRKVSNRRTHRNKKCDTLKSFLESYPRLEGRIKAARVDLTRLPKAASPNAKMVRCLCATFDLKGSMTKCSRCHYWQHNDCLEHSASNAEMYVCKFCIDPSLLKWSGGCEDVLLGAQSNSRYKDCVHYRAMKCDKVLAVRVGDYLYVRRSGVRDVDDVLDACEESSLSSLKINQSFHNNSMSSCADELIMCKADDVFIVRVDHLLSTKSGQRLIVARHFNRPHQTFCSANQRFHSNEVFFTPIINAVLLEHVVGRCIVLDRATFCRGRPKVPSFDPADVYFCEYRLNNSQAIYNRASSRCKNFTTDIGDYALDLYPSKLLIERKFSPFRAHNASAVN